MQVGCFAVYDPEKSIIRNRHSKLITKKDMHLSIIIPTLNEAKSLPIILDHVMQLTPSACEIIVVDGGSTDNTAEIARQYTVKILQTDKACRALQMNMGALSATGDYLCFLHADTFVPQDLIAIIQQTLSDDQIVLAGFTSIMKGPKKYGGSSPSLISLKLILYL